MKLELGAARGRKPRQVALHVGQENRNSGGGKPFGQDLQRDRLAGAGGPGNKTVPVGIFQRQALRDRVFFPAATDKNLVFQIIRPLSQIFLGVNILS